MHRRKERARWMSGAGWLSAALLYGTARTTKPSSCSMGEDVPAPIALLLAGVARDGSAGPAPPALCCCPCQAVSLSLGHRLALTGPYVPSLTHPDRALVTPVFAGMSVPFYPSPSSSHLLLAAAGGCGSSTLCPGQLCPCPPKQALLGQSCHQAVIS